MAAVFGAAQPTMRPLVFISVVSGCQHLGEIQRGREYITYYANIGYKNLTKRLLTHEYSFLCRILYWV